MNTDADTIYYARSEYKNASKFGSGRGISLKLKGLRGKILTPKGTSRLRKGGSLRELV